MWLVMVLFATQTFTVAVDSRDECIDFVQMNQAHWAETGQAPMAVCMQTFEV